MKLWKWWLLVVIAASGPWYGVTRTPQWQRVTWIPFHGAEDKPRDMVANVAMWVPFGFSFAAQRRGASRVAAAVAATLGASCAVEAAQLFFVLRDPSATDVLAGVAGSALGAIAAQVLHRSDTPAAHRRPPP